MKKPANPREFAKWLRWKAQKLNEAADTIEEVFGDFEPEVFSITPNPPAHQRARLTVEDIASVMNGRKMRPAELAAALERPAEEVISVLEEGPFVTSGHSWYEYAPGQHGRVTEADF